MGAERLQLIQLREFLVESRVLVFDDQQGTRNLVRHVLIRSGVSQDRVLATKNFDEAREYIERTNPGVIITEYEASGRFGLELAAVQKELRPQKSDRLFLICSAQLELASVVEAAEEEIDGFLIKPISEQSFEAYLIESIERKKRPSEDSLYLEKARSLISAGDLKGAEEALDFAGFQHPKPSNVFYLKGQIAEARGDTAGALRFYEEGLALNPKHFKCLSAKFLAHCRMQETQKAYDLVSEIRRSYPLTPDVLKHALITVVKSDRLHEVDEYFAHYLRVRHKSDDLKQVVSLSFFTAGKMLLKQNKLADALGYFKKGAIVAGRQSDFLEAVIDTLLKHGQIDECKTYFEMFEPDEVSARVIRCMRFRVMHYEGRKQEALLEEGRRLISDGDADLFVCDTTIEAALVRGNKLLTETIVGKAIKLHPQLHSKYRHLLA